MNLRDYQSKYVEKLTKSFKELAVAGTKGATIIFKSPTGSGKTVMTAAMLQQLAEDGFSDGYVFLWASMGDLAHQSYEKLSKNYLKDSRFNMLELSEITAEALESNTILFCNWEKMYQEKPGKDDDGKKTRARDGDRRQGNAPRQLARRIRFHPFEGLCRRGSQARGAEARSLRVLIERER